MTVAKSLHTNLTIPITLIFAGIVLSSLLPDWEILGKILPSSQGQIWPARVIKASTGVIFLLLPFAVYLRVATRRHEKEQRMLFMASLKIIKQRVGIKLEQIDRFRELFGQYKYFLNSKQEQTISGLISDLGDVRALDEEIKPGSAITQEKKKEYICERRVILDRIKAIEDTVEKYLRSLN